jgi:hypothetical protein
MDLIVSVYNTSNYPVKDLLLTASGITIDCNGSVQTNVNTYTFSVASDISVTVTISKTGFKTFTNTFTTYEGLPEIDIKVFLEPEVLDSNNANYLRVYPNFVTIPIPGSYNFLVLDLTSNTSSFRYYLDKEVYSEVRNFVVNLSCLGSHEIIQDCYTNNPTVALYPIWWEALVWYNITDDELTDYSIYETGVQINPINLNEYDIISLIPIEYKPSNTISSVVTNDGCSSDDCDCIPQGATVTVTPNVIINDNASVFDTPCTTSTLVYNLYNYDGNLVDTLTHTITNADPIDNSTLTFDFTLEEIGDYTLQVLLTNCYTTCEINQVYHICNFIKITETSCHIYTIYNCSDLESSNVLVTVRDLDDNILEGYNDVSLTNGSNITLTTPSDGVYIVMIKDADDETVIEQFVIIDICDLVNCLQTKIQELLCGCDCKQNTVDCTDYCKKRYDLNAIEALAFSLFNKINKEYRLNSIYTTFNTSTLAELTTMKNYIDAINSYCGCTGNSTGTGTTIFGNSSNSNCGCS